MARIASTPGAIGYVSFDALNVSANNFPGPFPKLLPQAYFSYFSTHLFRPSISFQPIVLMGREAGSGTREAFEELLPSPSVNPRWAQAPIVPPAPAHRHRRIPEKPLYPASCAQADNPASSRRAPHSGQDSLRDCPGRWRWDRFWRRTGWRCIIPEPRISMNPPSRRPRRAMRSRETTSCPSTAIPAPIPISIAIAGSGSS